LKKLCSVVDFFFEEEEEEEEEDGEEEEEKVVVEEEAEGDDNAVDDVVFAFPSGITYPTPSTRPNNSFFTRTPVPA